MAKWASTEDPWRRFVSTINQSRTHVILQLFDVFSLVRPTIVASTPRLWNMLYNQYIQELHEAYIQYQKERDLPSSSELDDTDQADVKSDEDSGIAKHFDVDKVPAELKREVMSRFRSKLGGREQRITTGGAPTGKRVKMFIIECFEGMVNEGYGSTEASSRQQQRTSVAR